MAERSPDGIHGAIADSLETAGYEIRTTPLQDPEHGLTGEVLESTDVLVWWSSDT